MSNSTLNNTSNITVDFDVAVIGGGIHGVGVAQAAAAAGYKTVLLEQEFLAYGTSRWSSKLVHGGLRYLESMEFGLVRESLYERELLLKLAPELVKRQKFHIPIYQHTSRRAWFIKLGLIAYWALAGGKKETRFSSIARDQWTQLDGLQTEGLQTVLQYTDAQTDDALLTQAVMASAQALGAELICPATVTSIRLHDQGAELTYQQGQQTQSLNASVVVNAAGPWAQQLLEKTTPEKLTFPVENIQGTHIELPAPVTQGCYYLEVPEDKRAVFVMPWQGHTLLGTTEYHYKGDPHDVHSIDKSVDYLLRVYRRYFPDQSDEVINRWAGLRVLPLSQGHAFKRSRETQLPTDRQQAPRMLSIFGGKLTGYRATGLKVMEKLENSLPSRKRLAHTHELKLSLPQSEFVKRGN